MRKEKKQYHEELRLAMLGSLHLHLGQDDLTARLPMKAQAALCYLLLDNHTHQRVEVAGKFWGEKSEEKSLGNLRQVVNKWRANQLEPFLHIAPGTLAFDQDSAYWCDVQAFERLLVLGRRGEEVADISLLRQAVDLYRGDFLSEFDPEDAFGFGEWMIAQRERLRLAALNAFDLLVAHYQKTEQFSLGIEYAHRLLALDPWREQAHRQLIWLFARFGQRSAALEQYEKCRELLMTELGVEPDPETTAVYQEAKNLRQTTRPLFPFLPVPVQPTSPFLAPPDEVHFVGRLRQMDELAAVLTAVTKTPRRLGIVGMGGVGKTTLAAHLAHRLRPHFPDGVLWATAVTHNPMIIAESWANALGYDFGGLKTEAERTFALRHLLAGKRALLIVDDVAVAAATKPLLPETGACAILFTSRSADVLRQLQAELVDLHELSDANGRHLLTVHMGDDRAIREPHAVAEICNLLQNLPLAVAMAGGYLNYRPNRRLADFATQLQHETNRLDLNLQDRQVRANLQVRATFNISWQGLDEMHRQVFRSLAVFNGREFAVAALASTVEIDTYLALDRLDYLVSHSLLQAAEPTRYRQHSLLADFAHELLGDDREAYGRMVAYYLTFATAHATDYGALRAEWSNLDAAIATAHVHHSWPLLMAYTAVLRPAWFARGRYAQARQAFAWAQEAAMALEDDPAVADIWLHWGEACREQGDFDEAWQKLLQSLELYRELENYRGVTAVQGNLARIGLDRAIYADVLARLDESLSISQTILADDAVTAELIYLKARLHHRQDDNQTARVFGQEALVLQEKVNDQRGLVRTLRLLAFVAIRLGEYDVAEELNGRALALSERLDDINEVAMSHRAMTQVYWRKNQLDAARQSAETSLTLLKKIGDRKAQALVEFQYLLIHKSAGEYAAAMHYAHTCLPVFEKLQFKDNIINTLDHMGDLSISLGKPDDACAYWRRALALAEEISLQRMIAALRQKLAAQDR